jgi:hypothetical protein
MSSFGLFHYFIVPRAAKRRGYSHLSPNPSNAYPVQTAELDIDAQNTITGAPLVLEFQKIFDRPAVPHDAIFWDTKHCLQWTSIVYHNRHRKFQNTESKTPITRSLS